MSPAICARCGAPIDGAAAFCGHCGAPLRAQPVQQSPVHAPASKSSPWLKVLLIVFGVFALCAALLVGGVAYVGYRIKTKVEQTAKRNGVDLGEFTRTGKPARRTDPCKLLTAQEASQILGVPIGRTERQESGGNSTCHYFGTGPDRQEAGDRISRNLEALKGNGPRTDRAEELHALENITKSMIGAATGQAYLAVSVDWEGGRAAVAATKLMAATAGPEMAPQPVQGIGDSAAFGPLNSMLYFSKGATSVQIDLRMVPDGREKGLRMARIIDSRL